MLIVTFSFMGEFLLSVYGESVDPNIYARFPDQYDILAGGDFAITYEIDDTTSGIDTTSDELIIQKWDGVSAWEADIANTYVISKNITTTLASYNISDLPFGKYRNTFSINDNDLNNTTVSTVFYIDEPEFILSRSEIDIGDLESGTQQFSNDELEITVKTLGAGFDLTMMKKSDLQLDPDNIISDWDATEGFGFDELPYSVTLTALGSSTQLATQSGSVNANGLKNVYTYTLKYGALIDLDDYASGEYESRVDFSIAFDYGDIDNRCRLDGVVDFSCDL